MTAPKVGDQVRVTFAGEVVDVYGEHRWCEVVSEGMTASVAVRDCTVIAPPIKVGDVVTIKNVERLPLGTVVAAPSSTVYERWSNVGLGFDWHGTNGEKTDDVFAFSILRIGAKS